MSIRRLTRAARRRQARAHPWRAADKPPAMATQWSRAVERTPKALAAAVRLLFLTWIVVLDFRPVTNNDFWFHLRVGEDILATGAIPHVDVYSLVQGQPFVEQGWLAAVVLALVDRHLGARAF